VVSEPIEPRNTRDVPVPGIGGRADALGRRPAIRVAEIRQSLRVYHFWEMNGKRRRGREAG